MFIGEVDGVLDASPWGSRWASERRAGKTFDRSRTDSCFGVREGMYVRRGKRESAKTRWYPVLWSKSVGLLDFMGFVGTVVSCPMVVCCIRWSSRVSN